MMCSASGLQASRLLAGVVALAGDAGPASVADADLARLEDARGRRGFHRGAVDGHPSRSACRRLPGRSRPAPPGLAGALIATFFYIAPTVGETLGIVAFVTVSLGGFGSVPGALVAGLLIGVIESVSAYWIGAVYKDIVVYSLFLCFLWFRPQGLMGKM